MTMIGTKAPDWSGPAYVKGEQKTLSSKDLQGKWYVLYWYPLDFTFVCPTEIKGFQDLQGEFKDDGVEVVGVSTDSFYSHKAWFADRKTFPKEITHPVVADTNHSVTKAFGVLKEDLGVRYRATVVVDDQGVIRCMAVNDLSVGRSPAETLRTVQALTMRLKDVNPGPASSAYSYYMWGMYPQYSGPRFGVLGGELFFGAYTGGSGFELWKTDGTESGTQLVKELIAGDVYRANLFDSFTAAGQAC